MQCKIVKVKYLQLKVVFYGSVMGLLTDFAWVMAVLAMGLLGYAALHDLAARTVPNWVSVAILGLGAAIRLGDHSLIAGLAIVVITFVILTVIWRFGAIGGGDVKLWSASALLISPHWQPEMSFITQVALTGGVLALLYLGLRFVVPLPAHRKPAAWLGGFCAWRPGAFAAMARCPTPLPSPAA
jgi:prepilin peptidase CpaA